MASQVFGDDKRARANIYDRSNNVKEETKKLLKQEGLTNDLIPLDDIQECGYVGDIGFVWMKWKVEHKFKAIGRLVQYDTEISGYIEQQKMKKVSELKKKELREWITISEISIDDPANKMKDLRESITISEISISEISINGPASAKICFKSDIGNNKSISGGPSSTNESHMRAMKKGSQSLAK